MAQQQHGAKCTSCAKVLRGNWNMTKSGEGYNQTGRYLGVSGYFLYGTGQNWVYCYCFGCWKKEILNLPFVKEQYKNIRDNLPDNFIQGLRDKKTKLSQEIEGLLNRLRALKVADSVIQSSIKPIQEEMNKIDGQIQILSQ